MAVTITLTIILVTNTIVEEQSFGTEACGLKDVIDSPDRSGGGYINIEKDQTRFAELLTVRDAPETVAGEGVGFALLGPVTLEFVEKGKHARVRNLLQLACKTPPR